jgi:hypothetical protein
MFIATTSFSGHAVCRLRRLSAIRQPRRLILQQALTRQKAELPPQAKKQGRTCRRCPAVIPSCSSGANRISTKNDTENHSQLAIFHFYFAKS